MPAPFRYVTFTLWPLSTCWISRSRSSRPPGRTDDIRRVPTGPARPVVTRTACKPDQLRVPSKRTLRHALLRRVVDIDEAEARCIAGIPLEIVEQGPDEIAADARSCLHRGTHRVSIGSQYATRCSSPIALPGSAVARPPFSVTRSADENGDEGKQHAKCIDDRPSDPGAFSRAAAGQPKPSCEPGSDFAQSAKLSPNQSTGRQMRASPGNPTVSSSRASSGG